MEDAEYDQSAITSGGAFRQFLKEMEITTCSCEVFEHLSELVDYEK
jgi:hypothetical protein